MEKKLGTAENFLDYIADAVIRATHAAASFIGLGITLLLSVIGWIIFRVDIMNALTILIAAFLVVLVLCLFWELRATFPNISIEPLIESKIPYDGTTMYAVLYVKSGEPSIMTCYATMEYVYAILPIEVNGEDCLYKFPYETGRLEFSKQNKDEENCGVKIPSFDRTSKIIVAEINHDKGIGFAYCKKDRLYDGSGLYVMKIRIDGQLRDREIYPRYFNGYLFAQRFIDSHDNMIVKYKTFKQGDWRQDPEIPDSFRIRRLLRDEKETANR